MSASIFPSKPLGQIPPTVIKTFNFLKSLPDGFKVWHHLAPWQENKPDFLVIGPENKAVIIKVSNATQTQWESRIQMLLMGDRNEKIGENETAILLDFSREFNHRIVGRNEPSERLKCVVLFPNLTSRQIRQLRSKNYIGDSVWLGNEFLSLENIDQWDDIFPEASLDEGSHHHIRVMFTPEVVVPRSLTVRQQTDRNIRAGLQDFLLDYDQENALKNDLELPDDAANISRDFQTSLVNGVAGSGKTLILLYRLRLLHEFYPSKQFLILTHNRALIRDLQMKYYRLCGDFPGNIEWKTFYQWLNNHWPNERFPNPIGQRRKERILQQIWAEKFIDTKITESMLISEIDWINDQVDRSRENYLTAERRGRGFRLFQSQRIRMYDAYEQYLSILRNSGTVDWGLVPHVYWNLVKERQEGMPQYDVILVDETQFFAPIWFEIVRHIVKPHIGHVFMAADPTQGFLNRGTSWKSMGLEVRGRSFELKRSYRTTKEIMTLATVFYRQRVPSEDADEGVLEPETFDMPEGVIPQLIPLENYQNEITRVANEIQLFVTKFKIPKNHVLVLHANWQGANDLIGAINQRLGINSARDPRDHNPGNYIRVTTLNRGTGIESPIVFFVGMNQLMEYEQSLRISDEEREQVIKENTRKIFMAMTRAGQRLVITYAGNMPNDIQWIFQ